MITMPYPVHVPTHPRHKLGLQTPMQAPLMSFSHMKDHMGIAAPPHPVTFDFLSKFPADCGVLLNDTLGDCAFAGPYHGIQVAEFAIKQKLINPNSLTPLVLKPSCPVVAGRHEPD